MRPTIFFLIIFLIVLSQSTIAAPTIYWLRGDDVSALIEGETFSFMSSTSPSSNSTETIRQINVSQGKGEIARWYSSVFPQDFLLSGKIFFWASEFELRGGDAQYRFSLYEFDTAVQSSSLIAASDWFDFEGGAQEAELELGSPLTIKAQNRLKLVLEYNSISSSSIIRLVLDQPQPFQQIEWSTPTGLQFSAFGVKNTAAILLEMCSAPSIECYSDFDCDDSQALTRDTCINPSTCSAECTYTKCDTGCVSNAECNDKNPLTLDVCSGLGACNAFCSNTFCEVGCQASSECDDQNPATLDQCVYPKTCKAFCQNVSCEGEECAAEEINVCGNGLCEFGEDCTLDCLQDKKVELLDVLEGEYFLFGEKVKVKAKVSGFALLPTVTLSGFFGETELLDDGQGSDEKANDGVFSGSFSAQPPNQGLVALTITATDGHSTTSLVKYFVIAPVLEADLKTNKKNYYSTDRIIITAFANRKGEPIAEDLLLTIEDSGGETISQQTVSPNQYGLYNFTYQLSSLDKEGELKITVLAADEFGNTATKTKTVFFSGGGLIPRGLEIEVLGLSREVPKGVQQRIVVKVKNSQGQLVKNAAVTVQLFSGLTADLTETELGVYTGFFELKEFDFSGTQSITIEAKKAIGGKEFEAKLVEKIVVLPMPIELEITGLEKGSFSVGEPIEIKVAGKVNGKPVPLKEVTIKVGEEEVTARKENGVFIVQIVLEAPTQITISAVDLYQNAGSSSTSLGVSGYYLPYYVESNLPLFFGLVLLVLGTIGIAGFIVFKGKEQERLKKRETEVIKGLKVLQRKYFQEGFLKRKDYDQQLLKLENELKDIRRKLGKVKK